MFGGMGKNDQYLRVSFFIDLKVASKECVRFPCFTLLLGGFQFTLGFITSLHAMKFYKNLNQTKVLPSNFLTLKNLTSYDMSRTSKEIISLQRLCCFFKGFFSVKNFAQNFRYGSFKESSLMLSFSNFFGWFENVLRVSGLF